jgi:hypothetical protein
MEGWADFNESLEDPSTFAMLGYDAQHLIIEKDGDKSKPYDQRYRQLTNPTFQQATSNEAVIARTMVAISKLHPDGVKRVREAFRKSNGWFHGYADFLREYVRANPGDTTKVAALVDSWTGFSASDEQLEKALGKPLPGYRQMRAALTTALTRMRQTSDRPDKIVDLIEHPPVATTSQAEQPRVPAGTQAAPVRGVVPQAGPDMEDLPLPPGTVGRRRPH